ncbi:MAG TPA: hypothetical protein VEI01_06215 [Terriglobales bacterium]|nr:hypothetical protein [Terriglobales bacterium]
MSTAIAMSVTIASARNQTDTRALGLFRESSRGVDIGLEILMRWDYEW